MDTASLVGKFPPSETTENALAYRGEKITPEFLEALDGEEVTVSNTLSSASVHGKVDRCYYVQGSFAVRYEEGVTSWSRHYPYFKEITIHLVSERAT